MATCPGGGIGKVTDIGGKATVDKAEANDWFEVSASARTVITDLSPLSLLREFSSFSSN